MNKVLLNFDAVAYRKKIIDMRNKVEQEYLKNQGTLDGMSYKSMKNAFDLAIEEMDTFATFENEI